jgi:hypothetical protein
MNVTTGWVWGKKAAGRVTGGAEPLPSDRKFFGASVEELFEGARQVFHDGVHLFGARPLQSARERHGLPEPKVRKRVVRACAWTNREKEPLRVDAQDVPQALLVGQFAGRPPLDPPPPF